MPETALIIGCGYVGLPLFLQLRHRYQVDGWVHSETGARGLRELHVPKIIVGSVADEAVWKQVDTRYDLVIHCASSSRGGEEAYAQVFREGMRCVVANQPGARKLMVSSTSVYAQTDGALVTEESPAEPTSATGRILRNAEDIALGGGCTIIRSSGIYGPGRAVLWSKFARGDAVIEGDGQRWINQIHRDDLIAVIQHLAEHGKPGEIFNATDDVPMTQLDFYTFCAETQGKPLPPFGPVNTQRKRGLSNKRVSNAKLRATGWTPLYPSFKDWLSAAPPEPAA